MKKLFLFSIISAITFTLFSQQIPTVSTGGGRTNPDFWSREGNDNSVGTNNILGTRWNSPIYFITGGLTLGTYRGRLNGRLTSSGTQYNINGYDWPDVNATGYLGIGSNNNNIWSSTASGPFSQLHLNGRYGNFLSQSSFRPWMKTGVMLTDNHDDSYIGLRRVDNTLDLTETVIGWGDNPSISSVGPDDVAFRFLQGANGELSQFVNVYDATDIDGRNIARFQGSGEMALGPRFGATASYIRAVSHLHIDEAASIANWMQITNNDTDPTADDGLRLGLDFYTPPSGGPAISTGFLRWQEITPFIIQTDWNGTPGGTAGGGERMRISSVNAPGVPKPVGLDDNRTRVSISHWGSGAARLDEPRSLLHIGYDINTPTGERDWMDVGTMTSRQRESVYLGLNYWQANPGVVDAILNWGDNSNGVMRFLYTSDGASNGAGVQGLEVGRFSPLASTYGALTTPPNQNGMLGIGDFTASPGPTHKLHVRGDGRFEVIPDMTVPEYIITGQAPSSPTSADDLELRKLAFDGNPNNVLLGNGTWGPVPGSGDHDWYDVPNTATIPGNIANSIYTLGRAGIGIGNPITNLHVGDLGNVSVTSRVSNSVNYLQTDVLNTTGKARLTVDNGELNIGNAGIITDFSNIKVGIGTGQIDPNYQLHLHNLNSQVATLPGEVRAQFTNNFTGSTLTNGLLIGITPNGVAEINQQEENDMFFFTEGVERMRIMGLNQPNKGTVFVGNSLLSIYPAGPRANLHVHELGTTTSKIQVTNEGSTPANPGGGGLQIGITGGSGEGSIRMNENLDLRLGGLNSVGIPREAIRIVNTVGANNGFVGVGDFSAIPLPTHQLDVAGDARIRNLPVNNALTDVVVADPTGCLFINTTIGAGGAADADWFDAGTTNGVPALIGNDIYSNGFVGISGGLAFTPQARLHVQGAVLVDGGGGGIPSFGAGTKMMYVPAEEGAFRAGFVNGTQWNVMGNSSASFGRNNIGEGNYSFTAGNGNFADGPASASIALGQQNSVTNAVSIAIGQGNVSAGGASVAIGNQGSATGNASITLSTNQARATTNGSIAIGAVVESNGINAHVIGTGASLPNPLVNNIGSSLAIGYNSDIPTVFVSSSAGVGTTGNVGISTGTPAFKLDVSGDVRCTGSVALWSDRRYKQEIVRITKTIEKIKKLNGYNYSFKQTENEKLNFPEGKQIGVIAQELEVVFPELILEDEEGNKAVKYTGLIPVLIEATKEQQQIIEDQNQKIEQLTSDFEELKALITENTTGLNINTLEIWLSDNGKHIVLNQNQPNPFSKMTTITYFIPENVTDARILIYGINGKLIKDEKLQIGNGMIKVYASDIQEGTYTYSIIADNEVIDTKKMVLTK